MATVKLIERAEASAEVCYVAELLRPCPSEGLRAYRVGAAVNGARDDGPGCAEAVG
jgi:putative SOS response-associated peptidase YedK